MISCAGPESRRGSGLSNAVGRLTCLKSWADATIKSSSAAGEILMFSLYTTLIMEPYMSATSVYLSMSVCVCVRACVCVYLFRSLCPCVCTCVCVCVYDMCMCV